MSLSFLPPMLVTAGVGCVGWFTRPNLARRRATENLFAHATTAPRLAATSLGSRSSKSPLASETISAKTAYRLAVELSVIVDIVMVGVSSGLSVLAALQLAARDGPARLGQRLGALLEQDDLPLADALGEFGRYCGPRAKPFVEVLASSIRYGIPLVPALERIQHELREETRRRIDKRVRQLPVLMLFPLIFCVLPALGLVGVVPVLVAAFQL